MRLAIAITAAALLIVCASLFVFAIAPRERQLTKMSLVAETSDRGKSYRPVYETVTVAPSSDEWGRFLGLLACIIILFSWGMGTVIVYVRCHFINKPVSRLLEMQLTALVSLAGGALVGSLAAQPIIVQPLGPYTPSPAIVQPLPEPYYNDGYRSPTAAPGLSPAEQTPAYTVPQ